MNKRPEIVSAPVPDRLLDAALDSFRRLGVQRTRVEDIAAAAGMARTAIYRFYPNKRAMGAAVVARALLADETRLAELARDHDRSPVARLRNLLRAEAAGMRTLLADRCLAALLADLLAEPGPGPGHGDVWVQHRRGLRAHYAALVRNGQRAGRFRTGNAESLAQTVEDMTRPLHDPRLLLETGTREAALVEAVAEWLERRGR